MNKLFKILISILLLSIFFIVLAQDNSTESINWKFKTSGKINSTPLIHKDRIYVGSEDGNFYAVDKSTGKEIWRYKTGFPVYSSAAISGDKIIFESGYFLFVLDLNGKLVRKIKLFGFGIVEQMDAWDFHHSSPVVKNGNVYIGSPTGGIQGYSIESGDTVLNIVTKNRALVRTTPIISENKIYFGDWDGVFFCYDKSSGEQIWNYDTRKDTTFQWTNAVHEKPIMVNDKIYFAGRSCMIYCLNAKTGEKIWSHISENSGWLVGGPTYSEGKVFLGSSNEFIIQSFNAENGKKLWETKLNHRIWGKPAVYKDKILVGSGSLFEVEQENGKVNRELIKKEKLKIPESKFVWKQFTGDAELSSFHSPAVVENNIAYIGCDDGNLYSIKLK